MGRVVIPGFRKIETSGGGEGGTSNYNDLTNKPSINNVPLVGNLNTVDLKLTDSTLTKEGVPAESKTVGTKLNELEGKYAKKDLYDDTTINVGRKAGTKIGSNSTSEGSETIAAGYCSHAEGYDTTADGDCSHAEGQGTNANFDSQHVQGKYNIEDTESKYAHIVGNGTSKRKRSNAHTLDWEGNAWYAGDVCNGNGVSLDGLNSNLAIKLVASNISDNGKITYNPEANTVYLYVNLHFSATDVYIIKVLDSSQFNATRLHGNSEGTTPYETFSFSNGELSIQSYGGHRGYLYKINGVECG